MPTEIRVDEMTCGGCEQTVEDAILEVEGAEAATADRESGTVTIEGNPDVDTVIDTVTDAGYPAEQA